VLRQALINQRELVTLRGHTGEILDAKFDAEVQRAITASADKTSVVWDERTGNKSHSYRTGVQELGRRRMLPSTSSGPASWLGAPRSRFHRSMSWIEYESPCLSG
jgi:WD40 repeat protein